LVVFEPKDFKQDPCEFRGMWALGPTGDTYKLRGV